MKRIFIGFLVIFIAVFAADRLVGMILENRYFNQKQGEYHSATQAIERQKCDLVVLGSSRAKNHYDPQLLSDSTGMSTYNMGRSGCFVLYQCAQFEMMLERHTPKAVILDITPYDFDYSRSDYDRLSTLLPYYSAHPEVVGRFLMMKSHWERYKLFSRIYPYNGMLLELFSRSGSRLKFRENGFQPLVGKIQNRQEERGTHRTLRDEVKVREFLNLVSRCRERGIALYLCISPFYAVYHPTPTTELLDSVSGAYGIPYRSFLNDPRYDARLFATNDHLNETGARKFSSDVVQWIEEIHQTHE